MINTMFKITFKAHELIDHLFPLDKKEENATELLKTKTVNKITSRVQELTDCLFSLDQTISKACKRVSQTTLKARKIMGRLFSLNRNRKTTTELLTAYTIKKYLEQAKEKIESQAKTESWETLTKQAIQEFLSIPLKDRKKTSALLEKMYRGADSDGPIDSTSITEEAKSHLKSCCEICERCLLWPEINKVSSPCKYLSNLDQRICKEIFDLLFNCNDASDDQCLEKCKKILLRFFKECIIRDDITLFRDCFLESMGFGFTGGSYRATENESYLLSMQKKEAM